MVRLYFGAGFRQVNGADIIESGSDGFANVPDHLAGDPALTQHVKEVPLASDQRQTREIKIGKNEEH